MNNVCLTMIVKNEAERLPRCLDSVLPYVDRVAILDTGSTDRTVIVASDRLTLWNPNTVFWEIDDAEFVDFSHARNAAICLAESAQAAAYQIILDADMTLSGDVTALRKCTKDLGLVQVQDVGGSTYWLPLLRRHGCGLWYKGRTHETIQMVDGNYERIDGVLVTHHADGGGRADKFERDLRLLDEDLAEDPTNTRTAFYRAQTLRCLGHHDRAIAAYQHRISLGGWDEEIWYSHLQIARSLRALGDAAATTSALLAYSLRTHRAEPLADLARWAREDGMPAVAEMFAARAVLVAWPCRDLLFVEPDAWCAPRRILYDVAASRADWASACYHAGQAEQRGWSVLGAWGRAKALWELGEREEALAEIERALRLAPNNANVRADAAVMRRIVNGEIAPG